MWINKLQLKSSLLQISVCIYMYIMSLPRSSEACGHYEMISGGAVGYIATESPYDTNINCIWWLETEQGYKLSINITYVGDVNYGRCGDFIIVRESYDDADILLDESWNCSTLTHKMVNASSRWLQVQFKSDGVNYTSGFQGYVYSTYTTEATSNTNPIRNCYSYELGCANKVCMTMSYRCDGYNDCGCTTDCDEYQCTGFGLDKFVLMAIGCGLGFGVFLAFFFFSLAYEVHLRRKALMADPEAQAALQKEKKAKLRREAYKKAQKEKKKGRQ